MTPFQRLDLRFVRKTIQPRIFLTPSRTVVSRRVVSDSGSGSYVAPTITPTPPDPTFAFMALDFDYPPELSITGAGTSTINSDNWTIQSIIGPRWYKNNTSTIRILYSTTRNQWEIVNTALTSTYVYSNPSNDSDVLPLTGWQSWNGTWSPAPTISPVMSPKLSTCLITQAGDPIRALIHNTDYYFDTSTYTYYGYISASDKFAAITDLNIKRYTGDTIYLNYLPSLSAYSGCYLQSVQNNSIIKTITLYLDSSDPITITSNPSLTTLFFTVNKGIYKLDNLDISNNPEIQYLRFTNVFADNINVNYPNLQTLWIYCSSLKNENLTLQDLGNLNYCDVSNTSLSGYEFVDTFFDALCANSYNTTITYYYNIAGGSSTVTPNFGRSSSSNNAFWDLYRNSKLLTPDFEYDPLYPKAEISQSFYTATNPSSSVTVCSPISNSVFFYDLTGKYTYTGNTYNNRSVFTNTKDYHILYNSNQKIWTLVGPTSTSNVVWLSCYEGLGDYGNVPTGGWSGAAYQNGTFYQPTEVFDTTTQLFSSIYFNPSEKRYSAAPDTGYSGNFYWKNLDFSGVGWADYIYAGASGRAHLISPVHVAMANHFPLDNGSTVKFYHKDGSVSSRTLLSSVNGFGDLRIGILSAPVSACCYRVSKNSIIKDVTTAPMITSFLWGPGQTGRVGIAGPWSRTGGTSEWGCYVGSSYYKQLSSIPKSLWHGGAIVEGDSSTGFWRVKDNELILIGTTQSSGPNGMNVSLNGSLSSIQTINQAMTALSLYAFGLGTNSYTLSTYSFEP